MNTAEHLEHYLGPIGRGWSSASCPGVQVCLFRARPLPEVATLATLGLSNTVLSMTSGRSVRQELVFSCRNSSVEEAAKLLIHVAERLILNGRALLRGEVVPLGEPVSAGSSMQALYASMPVTFPEGFATLRGSNPPTVMVWLVPLLPAEALLVEQLGWAELENRLEAAQPDLFDLARSSIV